jgi:hypothetical protein
MPYAASSAFCAAVGSPRPFMPAAFRGRHSSGPANGLHAKLCGRGPRAEAGAARRLPRITFAEPSGVCDRRDAVTLAMKQPARPATRSPAAPASA